MADRMSQRKLNKQLIRALKKEDLSLAEEFLKAGANSNHFQMGLFTENCSPASIAIEKDRADMLQLLMTYGLNQNQTASFQDSMYVSLVLLAALHNSKKTLKLLAEDLKTDFNINIVAGDQISRINIENRKQLINVSVFRSETLNIIKNAVPVRAEKERLRKQQEIRKTKFGF